MPIRGPRPQREMHAPTIPTRARPATLSFDHHIRLARRLTPRDRWLIRMLHEHRVLTTDQVTTMAFPSPRAARHRLLELYRWNVIDRFQPLVGVGSAPMHYVLGAAGAGVLAGEEGITISALGYRRDDALAIAHRHTLAHTVAVNDVFAHLVHHSVADREVRLVAWWSETRCARSVGDLARPDAYGRITTPPPDYPGHRAGPPGVRSFEWFLELDFGTEPLHRLAAKLDGYAHLAAATHPTPVLIWLPSPPREAHAREHLTHALRRLDQPDLVPVATATPYPPSDPPGGRARTGQRSDSPELRWLPIDLTRHHSADTHARGAGRAGARGDTTRCGLAGLAAVWPARAGESHAALLAPDRARTRIVDLPAPDPVPPDPATFNPATGSPARPRAATSSTAGQGASGPTTSESRPREADGQPR